MSIVTQIKPVRQKFKISLDCGKEFMLYKGETKRFQLSEGTQVSEECLEEIYKILYNRAKERALYLLDRSPKTEKEIRDKLFQGGYPEEICDSVISYLKEYFLVDDERYVATYLEYKSKLKSKKQMMQELYAKGISAELFTKVYDEKEISEFDALDYIIQKRSSRYDMSDMKSVQRFYQYLVSKGYHYHDVKERLEHYIHIESM